MNRFTSQIIWLFIIIVISVVNVGCEPNKQADTSRLSRNHMTTNNDEHILGRDKIIPYEGEPSQHINQVYTTEPKLALTFNGLTDEKEMNHLLERLQDTKLHATFFLTHDELQNNFTIVEQMIAQGHTIESSLLHLEDLQAIDYQQLYKEIKKVSQTIEEISNVKPSFTRLQPWKTNQNLRAITAQQKMEAVIGHSIRPRDRDLEEPAELKKYFERALSRGGIISLDVADYPQVIHAIDYIIEESEQLDYSVISLRDLVQLDGDRKPFAEIEGSDLLQKNLDYKNEQPHVFYAKQTDEKVVALTFDDYGSDKTVLEILDILEKNDIQSTFFLKAKDVQKNPNLAKLILDEGHEVANHSYAHLRSTELTPEELQEDLIQAHQIITEAIQEKPMMLFRPPYGNIDEESAQVMSAVGFNDIAMYDISSYDWNADYTVEDVINRVMNNVKPGSTIVMHMLDDIKNIETLPIIIEKLRSRGFGFVKMSEWFDDL